MHPSHREEMFLKCILPRTYSLFFSVSSALNSYLDGENDDAVEIDDSGDGDDDDDDDDDDDVEKFCWVRGHY